MSRYRPLKPIQSPDPTAVGLMITHPGLPGLRITPPLWRIKTITPEWEDSSHKWDDSDDDDDCSCISKITANETTAHRTFSFLYMWGSWLAYERLGMCCSDKRPFSLNHMPKNSASPSTSLELTHNHTLDFYQHPPPHPTPTTQPSPSWPTTVPPNTPDNCHQLRWKTQCAGWSSSAGLTPHLTPAWPLACDSSSLKAALLCSLIRTISLSPLTTLPAPSQGTRSAVSASSGQPGQLNSNWG